MKVIAKLIRYCYLHLFRNPKYLFKYAFAYLNKDFVPNISYYSYEDLPELIDRGKALIRFGDGDIYTINGGGQPYQEYDKKLAEGLFNIIKNYGDNSNYVICLNKAPLSLKNNDLRNKGLLGCWLPTKVYWELYFNKKSKYHDAAMFYYRDTIPKYLENKLKRKKILFLSSQENIDKLVSNKNIPFKDIEHIVTPSVQAFRIYEKIKSELIEKVNVIGKQNVIVLAAFGPASKVLAYELSQMGIQVLDVGQGITAAYTDSDHSLSENIRVLQ